MRGNVVHSPALESALIGCFGGLFATLCVYPLDLVKNKLSAHVEGDVGDRNVGAPPVTSSSVAAAIFKEKGVSGFYSGFTGRALHCFVEDFVFFWCVFYSGLHDC